MVEFLLSPLRYEFMVRGLIAAVTVGVVCSVLGAYVVLRGMTFFGDALAHAILPGVAIAYLLGGAQGPLFWGGLVAGIGTAVGIGALSKIGQCETRIGVIFAGMFALGVALISTVRNFSVDLTHFRPGNVSVSGDLALTVGFGALALLVVAFTRSSWLSPSIPFCRDLILHQAFSYLLLVICRTVVIAPRQWASG